MTRSSRATRATPTAVDRAVKMLAQDIAVARTRRRIPQRLLAERMMVSLDTVQRLEHGDPGISLGVLATALWSLGLLDNLTNLASPDHDTVGQTEEQQRLPRRVRTPPPDPSMQF